MSNKPNFLKQETLEQYKEESEKYRKRFLNKRNINISIIIIFFIIFSSAIFYSFFPIFSIRYKLQASSLENGIQNKIIGDYYQMENTNGKTLPLKNISSISSSDINSLRNDIEKELSSLSGEYGIYVKNLKTQESLDINKNRKFTAASLDKLFVAASYYTLMEDSSKSLNDSLLITQQNFINNEKGNKIKLGGEYNTKELVQCLLKQSDSNAYLTLVDEIGLDYIDNFIKNNGFNDTDFINNDSSPEDVGNFLEKLYNRKLFNDSRSDEMLSFMQNTIFEDRIPYYLPSGIKVSHKIGTWDGTYNDAGIVYSPGGDYIIVVMDDGADNEQAVNFIRKLSEIIYNYFN
ncbi:MAG TPA: class A beta-lactamase-related serine hydrolase [Patescibacteria group bacterium]|nr:class A beta-lactamase-related serine hydrolase [Patescibacteria group bacterium]